MRLLLPMLLGALAAGTTTRADYLLPAETKTIPLQQLNIQETLTFERFDPAFGPLLEVRIHLSADLQTIFEGVYGGSGVQNLDVIVNESVTLAFAETPQSPLLSLALQVTEQKSLTSTADNFIETRTDSDQATLVLTDPEALAAFIGPGTIDLVFNAVGTAIFRENTGGGLRRIESHSSGIVSVQYLVPEPGSFVLMALGGVGLFLAASRAHRFRSTQE